MFPDRIHLKIVLLVLSLLVFTGCAMSHTDTARRRWSPSAMLTPDWLVLADVLLDEFQQNCPIPAADIKPVVLIDRIVNMTVYPIDTQMLRLHLHHVLQEGDPSVSYVLTIHPVDRGCSFTMNQTATRHPPNYILAGRLLQTRHDTEIIYAYQVSLIEVMTATAVWEDDMTVTKSIKDSRW